MKKKLLLLTLALLGGHILTAATAAPQATIKTSQIVEDATGLYAKISPIKSDKEAVEQLANDLTNTEHLSNPAVLTEKLQTIGDWIEDGRRDFFNSASACSYDYTDLFKLTQEHMRELEAQGIQPTSSYWWENMRSGAALNQQGLRDWLSKVELKPDADRVATDHYYGYTLEYNSRRKKLVATFRAAKHLYKLEKALNEQRAYLVNMRGRIALERETTAAEAANKKALSVADVAGQLAVAEATRKAKEEKDKAKQERIKEQGKVAVDQIKAQGDASAKIAELQQPTLIAQHKETVAADKLKHDATLLADKEKHTATMLADKEQQEARLKARKSLVQFAIPALTIATILGIGGYFGIRHYYQPRPTIIERADTSMLSRMDKWRGFKVPASNLDAVILEPSLAQQVIGKFAGIVLAIQKGFPLSNMMFYGPPGTGKTMAAQAFARRLYEQGIADHVIIRGPAFKRLGSPAKAQEALANILRWASKNKRPVILVFDEAETMFADRDSNFANEMTNDLTTTMLSFFERGIHGKMMFIFSTNYPDRIEKALLNRIDGSNHVEFTAPGQRERESLLDSYLKQHLIDRGLSVSDEIRREKALLAQKMDGLVGRQIDSLVAQTIYAMLNKGNSMLDLQTLEVAIENARRSLQKNQVLEPLVR